MNNLKQEQTVVRRLPSLAGIKGIIFDMDGTVLNSMPMWDNLCIDYFKKYDLEFLPEYLRGLNAPSFMDAIKALNQRFFPMVSLEQMLQEWSAYLLYHYLNTVTLKPGVLDFMARMKAQHKQMCIATMTERQYVDAVVPHFGLEQYIAFSKTVGEVGKSKSHPDIYLEAAAALGLPPEKCLVIEDSCLAAKTARSANFVVWGVADPSAEKYEQEMKTICHYFVEDFSKELQEKI